MVLRSTTGSTGGGGGGDGDVNGPASSTAGNISVFADGTGKLIGDSGKSVTQIETDIGAKLNNDLDSTKFFVGGISNTAEQATSTEVTAMLNSMQGADAVNPGTKGMVPQPVSGEQNLFLRGDATWSAPSGSGDVLGPATSTDDHVATFDGATGKLIQDGGLTVAQLQAQFTGASAIASGEAGYVTQPLIGDESLFLRGDGTWATPAGGGSGDVTGPASAVDANLAAFDGTTGKIIEDSGVSIAVIQGEITGKLDDSLSTGSYFVGGPTGQVVEQTAQEVTQSLDFFVGASGILDGDKGLVPQPLIADASADKFLSAKGVWSVLPSTGGEIYQGEWDANSNTPALTSGSGTEGHYYIVSTPGTTNLDGIANWEVGDEASFNGTAWVKKASFNNDFIDAVVDGVGSGFGKYQKLSDLPSTAKRVLVTASISEVAKSGGGPTWQCEWDVASNMVIYVNDGVTITLNGSVLKGDFQVHFIGLNRETSAITYVPQQASRSCFVRDASDTATVAPLRLENMMYTNSGTSDTTPLTLFTPCIVQSCNVLAGDATAAGIALAGSSYIRNSKITANSSSSVNALLVNGGRADNIVFDLQAASGFEGVEILAGAINGLVLSGNGSAFFLRIKNAGTLQGVSVDDASCLGFVATANGAKFIDIDCHNNDLEPEGYSDLVFDGCKNINNIIFDAAGSGSLLANCTLTGSGTGWGQDDSRIENCNLASLTLGLEGLSQPVSNVHISNTTIDNFNISLLDGPIYISSCSPNVRNIKFQTGGTYTIVGNENVVATASTGAGNVVVNLNATPQNGDQLTIKANDNHTNTVTVNGNGASIDGQSSIVLAHWESITVYFDGTQWFIFEV